jgi:hypothetical protein
VSTQFVLDANGQPLALAQSYDTDVRNGTSHLSVLCSSIGWDRPGEVEAGVRLFLEHLFVASGLRKVYLHVLDVQASELLKRLPPSPMLEGTLAGNEWTSSGYADLLVYCWNRPVDEPTAADGDVTPVG